MPEASPLAAWESYYVIVGSSSAALTGLMFVVVTLIPEATIHPTMADQALTAFAGPTVSHFVAALLVSSLLSAPWPSAAQAGIGVAASGIVGAFYCFVIFRRMLRQTQYKPVREDWLWYVILPLLAYATLLVAGFALRGPPVPPLFWIGAAVLLLVFIGIHNAWDMVTYAVRRRVSKQTPE